MPSDCGKNVSFDKLFAVGRKLKQRHIKNTSSDARGQLYGEFLLEEGEARTPDMHFEESWQLVELLQSIVDGDTSEGESTPKEMDGFIELSLFDPTDPVPTHFYFALLAYSRSVVAAYVKEMHQNLTMSDDDGERGLIIPDFRVYSRPLYSVTSNTDSPEIVAARRNDKPTLYMGGFPSTLKSDNKDPKTKVESFLHAVSRRLVPAEVTKRLTIPIKTAFLITFPRPIGPKHSSQDEYLRGGGLFVYGNYEHNLLENAIRIQSRLVKQIMRVSHTQADTLRIVESAEESGRQARAHELRRLIAALDSRMPDCIFQEIRDYFRLVIAFDHLAADPPTSLLAMVEMAIEKACKLAIANVVCQQKLWENTSHWASGDTASVQFGFTDEVIRKANATIDIDGKYSLASFSTDQRQNLFMALVCLFRNVFLHGRCDKNVLVKLKHVEGSICVAITNYADMPASEIGPSHHDCNTEKAGWFYVSSFGGNPLLFRFMRIGPHVESKTMEWQSLCPLPLQSD